jgi:hypothetical protein
LSAEAIENRIRVLRYGGKLIGVGMKGWRHNDCGSHDRNGQAADNDSEFDGRRSSCRSQQIGEVRNGVHANYTPAPLTQTPFTLVKPIRQTFGRGLVTLYLHFWVVFPFFNVLVTNVAYDVLPVGVFLLTHFTWVFGSGSRAHLFKVTDFPPIVLVTDVLVKPARHFNAGFGRVGTPAKAVMGTGAVAARAIAPTREIAVFRIINDRPSGPVRLSIQE